MNGPACVQIMVVAGHVRQVVAQHRNLSVQNHLCMDFGHEDQVVFDHRDCKQQFLHTCTCTCIHVHVHGIHVHVHAHMHMAYMYMYTHRNLTNETKAIPI